MDEIEFKKVDASRRIGRASEKKYQKLFDALAAGDTIELNIDTKQATRIRSAWKGGRRHVKGETLHVVYDGTAYLAWLEK
jgi:hypothetical protein